METEQKKLKISSQFRKNFYWFKSCALNFQGDLWGSNPEFKVISGSGMAKNTHLDKIVQKPTQLLKGYRITNCRHV